MNRGGGLSARAADVYPGDPANQRIILKIVRFKKAHLLQHKDSKRGNTTTVFDASRFGPLLLQLSLGNSGE